MSCPRNSSVGTALATSNLTPPKAAILWQCRQWCFQGDWPTSKKSPRDKVGTPTDQVFIHSWGYATSSHGPSAPLESRRGKHHPSSGNHAEVWTYSPANIPLGTDGVHKNWMKIKVTLNILTEFMKSGTTAGVAWIICSFWCENDSIFVTNLTEHLVECMPRHVSQ